MDEPVRVRPLAEADRAWARDRLVEAWGGETVAVHGTLYAPAELPGLIATRAGERIGLLTCRIEGAACEIVTLNAFAPGQGAGTRLLEEAARQAGAAGCTRLWLITTNDNEPALAFYLHRGFRVVAVHAGAVAEARRLKPQIPLVGEGGRPIVDEVELERPIGAARAG